MRSPRGDIYNNEGFFHIESLIHPGLSPWTLAEAEAYEKLLEDFIVLSDLGLVFWMIHPRGFGLIVRKESDRAYAEKDKLRALRGLGEVKFAERWEAQAIEGSKKLSRGHSARRDFVHSLSQNVASFTKSYKQRISRAYNSKNNFGGGLWRERAKVFHLPDSPEELSEVAAYILGQAEVENGEDCLGWPGTVAEIRGGNEDASYGLRQIFGNSVPPPRQLDYLLERRLEVLEKIPTVLNLSTRGRRPAWRPACER